MSRHRIDPTALASATWLIEPAAGAALQAAVLAGNLEIDVPETSVIYDWQYGFYPTALHPDSTAIVDFTGVIYAGWSVSYAMEQLRRVAADPNVTGVVLRASSPGGDANAGERFASFMAEYPLPVVCYVDHGMACSAFYRVAAACGAIMASRGHDKIGSIGTYITWQSYKGMFEKAGIKQEEIYAEQSTQKNEENKAAERGDFSLLKAWATEACTNLIDFVTQQRGDALTAVAGMDPFKGRIFSATDALSIGLIDGIGTLEAAVALVRTLPKPNDETELTPEKKMLGFVKLAALTAIAGVSAENITEAQVEALNAELAEKGYEVGVVSAGQLESLNAQTAEVARLRAELATATAQAATLQTEASTLRAEVTRLGSQPGAAPTEAVATKDTPPAGETDDVQALLDSLPHNKALAGNPQFN